MKKIYACLCGEWKCLNSDSDCVMGEKMQSPDIWWEENAPIYFPKSIKSEDEHSFYNMNYINIHFHGKDYRINPIFIQVVTD